MRSQHQTGTLAVPATVAPAFKQLIATIRVTKEQLFDDIQERRETRFFNDNTPRDTLATDHSLSAYDITDITQLNCQSTHYPPPI